MKTKYTCTLCCIVIMMASCADKVLYFDKDYPTLTPKKYAEGLINLDSRFQQNLTMSPDGGEQLITLTDSEEWRYQTILRVRNSEGEMVIDTPQFVIDFNFSNVKFLGEPMISPDNKDLYFIADYPPDIWRSNRDEKGKWSKPTRLKDISTEKDDWYPTLSKDNTLYFTNGTLYKSKPVGTSYRFKEKIKSTFNAKDTRDACISPNKDYIIFTASDSLGYGKSDLYISFKDKYGNWSQAQNMGNQINTKHREFAPYISPDEKFLFFSRRDKWQHAEFSQIYWVSLQGIDSYRN